MKKQNGVMKILLNIVLLHFTFANRLSFIFFSFYSSYSITTPLSRSEIDKLSPPLREKIIYCQDWARQVCMEELREEWRRYILFTDTRVVIIKNYMNVWRKRKNL